MKYCPAVSASADASFHTKAMLSAEQARSHRSSARVEGTQRVTAEQVNGRDANTRRREPASMSVSEQRRCTPDTSRFQRICSRSPQKLGPFRNMHTCRSIAHTPHWLPTPEVDVVLQPGVSEDVRRVDCGRGTRRTECSVDAGAVPPIGTP